MLVSQSVNTLINGVSQQAENLRFSSQCTEQVNALPSVLAGLTKRPPTQHIGALSVPDVEFASFGINRTPTERYQLILGDRYLKVTDLNGNDIPVKNEAGNPVSLADLGYLQSTTPTKSLKPLTVADYTIILNREKVTQLSPKITPKRLPEAFVFVKQIRRGANYKVKFFDDPNHSTPDSVIELSNIETNIDNADSTDPKVADQSAVVRMLGEAMDAGTGISPVYIHEDAGGLLYIAKRNVVDATAAFAGESGLLASVTPLATATGRTPAEWLQDHVREEAPNGDTYAQHLLDTYGLATVDFRIEVECSIPEGMIVVKDSVQSFALLPRDGIRNFATKVVGDPDTTGDEYFIKYVPNNAHAERFTSGTWTESQALGLQDSLDAATMPHALVNYGDHFVFKPLTWGTRTCGDAKTNPSPSFVGRKLSDVFFFKNRLGFEAGENFVLSEAGEFFNFWRTTVIQLLDSDPIDVGASHTKVSELNSAVISNEQLLLFSGQTQFAAGSDNILTPKTVSVVPISEYENIPDVPPKAVGTAVFFPFKRGDCTGFYDYGPDTNTGKFKAYDVTEHAPTYIRGTVTAFDVCDVENMLVAKADAPDTLYVYRFFKRDSDRLQSAWGKWKFNGSVRSFFIISSTLYVVIKRGSSFFLEKLVLTAGMADEYAEYVTVLDRRITDNFTSVSYNSTLDRTTFVLPYAPDPALAAACTRSSATKRGGVSVTVLSVSGSSVVLQGDLRTVPLWFGEKYRMEYEMSHPQLRERKQTGEFVVVPGRFQVRYGTLAYDKTLAFRVEVTPLSRRTFTYDYAPRALNTSTAVTGSAVPPQSGAFRFPVFSKNDKVTIKIINDSPLPCSLLSVDWEALYTARAQRV